MVYVVAKNQIKQRFKHNFGRRPRIFVLLMPEMYVGGTVDMQFTVYLHIQQTPAPSAQRSVVHLVDNPAVGFIIVVKVAGIDGGCDAMIVELKEVLVVVTVVVVVVSNVGKSLLADDISSIGMVIASCSDDKVAGGVTFSISISVTVGVVSCFCSNLCQNKRGIVSWVRLRFTDLQLESTSYKSSAIVIVASAHAGITDEEQQQSVVTTVVLKAPLLLLWLLLLLSFLLLTSVGCLFLTVC
uniref:Uncharacterized protein n=1 Tax=Glossina palpalis gambiensis TaxID=67801 RepID=A0A1B0B387_9MUSC